MPSVLAIVSKAVFEKMAPNAQVGDLVKTDRYVSKHAAFDKLGGDGAIYLVTVRPPDEQLWLVGVLEGLKKRNGAWIGKANATKIASITDAMPELGITAKKGVLGMSLQTPRVLAEEVAAVLRERAGSAPSKRAATATAKSTSGKPAAAEPATRGKPVVEPSTRGKPVAQPTRGKPAAQRRRGKPVAPPPVAAPPPREVYKFVPAPKLDAAGKALLAKVLADPDDLATRGVFADHLIELGDPRGEYIQLALAHGGLADGDPKRAELADRLAELHGRHLRLHLEPLLGAKPEGLREHGFANGMIEAVELRAGSIKSLSKLAAVAPIRDVTISDYERPDNWLAQLAASPALPQIRKLQLSCSEDDPKLEAKLLALFESGQLAGLRALILGAPLTDRLVTAIAGTCRELHVLEREVP